MCLKFLTFIWGLPDSNPGRYQITRFIQSFQVKTGVTPSKRQRPLLSTSLTTESVLITKFDATYTVQAELLTPSNKPQINNKILRQWNVQNQSAANEEPTGPSLNSAAETFLSKRVPAV